MGLVTVVVGGQFGSEAKGHVTSKLAYMPMEPPLVVRVGGPNAGHSAVGVDGITYALRSIPIVAVTRPDAKLVIAAGSEIDFDVLESEIELLESAGFKVRDRLMIDGSATVIEPSHKDAESYLVGKIGSTGKGIGSARSSRIMRQAATVSEYIGNDDPMHSMIGDTADWIATHLQNGIDVIIEGVQGHGLGLHTKQYPYVTSSDTRAIDFLAMAGISPWSPWVSEVDVWVVFRTYPIRVAGNSGPMTNELTWDQMRTLTGIDDLEPERTTVTKKIRRIGAFDAEQAIEAIQANGGESVNVAVTFMDYIDPQFRDFGDELDGDGWYHLASSPFLDGMYRLGACVGMVTWGPDLAALTRRQQDGSWHLRKFPTVEVG